MYRAAPAQPPSNPYEKIEGYLTRIEKKSAELDERSKQNFTKELQLKLRESLLNTPEFRELQRVRKQLAQGVQTRFDEELGEPSATVSPLAQAEAASASRQALAGSLSDVQSTLELGGKTAQSVVDQLLEAETQEMERLDDEYQRERQMLSDTLSVERFKADQRRGGGGSAAEAVGGDDIELINLALESMTEEERKQIELLPTASRKAILVERGRQVRQRQQSQTEETVRKYGQAYQQGGAAGFITEGLTSLFTGTAQKPKEVGGLDDIGSFGDY